MNETETEKKTVRAQMRAKRDAQTPVQVNMAGLSVMRRIYELDEYEAADTVLTYVSVGSEMQTISLISHSIEQGKRVGVPLVTGKGEMKFIYISSISDLKPGRYGIPEPKSYRTQELTGGFMVTPGLAFDRSLHRIGYGGGFYDRYIRAHRQDLFCCCPAYAFQVIGQVPQSEFDEPVDMIITPDEIIR